MHPFFGPDPAKQDAEFRGEVQRLSRRALLICAFVEFGVTLVTYSVRRYLAATTLPFWVNLPFFALGGIALLAWRTPARQAQARAICLALGFMTAVCLSWVDVMACIIANGASFAAMDVSVVLLVLVALVPATFWQTLVFGAGVVAVQAVASSYAFRAGVLNRPDVTLLALGVTALLCSVLAGLNYQRLYEGHMAVRAAIDAESRRAQSEYAATVARLSAAMSHELNTPLGALRSAAESIVSAASRHAERPEPRLARLQNDLAGAIHDSAVRISDVVRTMQRFTNVDRAEVQEADLRQVLNDVARLCAGGVHIDVPSVPPVLLQPAVVGGVLANLIRRAVERGETLHITARPVKGAVELRVDLGADTSLEPEFQVRDGRVGTANWDLFHARQLLQASGASVRLDNTAMVISFPSAVTGATAV